MRVTKFCLLGVCQGYDLVYWHVLISWPVPSTYDRVGYVRVLFDGTHDDVLAVGCMPGYDLVVHA